MTSNQSRAQDSFNDVFNADSPAKHAHAVSRLLCDLADASDEGANACDDANGDTVGGAPWRQQAKRLARMAREFQIIGVKEAAR